MSKRANNSMSFNPNTNNLGGRSVISQQMYNHYASLLNTKSTINSCLNSKGSSGGNKGEKSLRTVKVDSNTQETLNLMKLTQKTQAKSSIVLADGITTAQWKAISDFKTSGQNLKKKKNSSVAMDHYLNLKAMYKKINEIKYKNAVQTTAFNVISTHEKELVNLKKETRQNPKIRELNDQNQDMNFDPKNNLKQVILRKKIKPQKTEKTKSRIGETGAFVERKEAAEDETPNEHVSFINQNMNTDDADTNDHHAGKPIADQDANDGLNCKNKETQEVSSSKIEKRSDLDSEELEERISEEEDEEVMSKLPTLESEEEEKVIEFKQNLLEMIINYEIFGQEEFENFFEAICIKNQHVEKEFLVDMFEEIKSYLHQQFEELLSQENQTVSTN